MADEESPKPGPGAGWPSAQQSASASDASPEPTVAEESDGSKDASPAEPEQEGVKTGGLVYTEQEDGLRNYPAQKPVDTQDDPTPTPPEEKSDTTDSEEPAQQ